MKICNKCLNEKEIIEFPKTGRVCKSCKIEYRKKYREINYDKVKESSKKYYQENREKILKYSKLHHTNNKEYYRKFIVTFGPSTTSI
jgi:hypothetical protein